MVLEADANSVSIKSSVSIGAALYPQDGHTVDEILSRADHAMYESKKAGKNRCTLASSVDI